MFKYDKFPDSDLAQLKYRSVLYKGFDVNFGFYLAFSLDLGICFVLSLGLSLGHSLGFALDISLHFHFLECMGEAQKSRYPTKDC